MKRKQRKARSLTTEQLAEQAIQQVQQMSEAEKAKLREHLSGLADAARKFAAEEGSQRPALVERTPTPRELELFKVWWKLKYGYEPRAHEIAGFDPDWTVLRAGYAGTGQKVLV